MGVYRRGRLLLTGIIGGTALAIASAGVLSAAPLPPREPTEAVAQSSKATKLTKRELAAAVLFGTRAAGRVCVRAVFRGTAALRTHETSEHYQAWHRAVATMLVKDADTREMHLDTVHPRTSPFPLRSGWTTV